MSDTKGIQCKLVRFSMIDWSRSEFPVTASGLAGHHSTTANCYCWKKTKEEETEKACLEAIRQKGKQEYGVGTMSDKGRELANMMDK